MSTAPFTPTTAQQDSIADYLVEAVVADATGVAEGDVCLGEPPSARYYLASLAPTDLNLAVNAVRMGRATPASLGFEFEVADDQPVELEISASLSCYYRRVPTWEEQDSYRGTQGAAATDYRLAPTFQRVPVEIGPIRVQIGEGHSINLDIGQEEFRDAFNTVRAVASADPRVERRQGDERRERSVPANVMNDEATFESWLDGMNVGDPVVPDLAARIHITSRRTSTGRRVTATLANESRDPVVVVQGRGRSAGQTRHDDIRDHFLFRASLSVHAEPGVLTPIHMDLGPDAYRYAPELPAYATNCGVQELYDGHEVVGLVSVAAPVYETSRPRAREHPATDYVTLESNPLPALRQLAADMRAYSRDEIWGTDGLAPELAARKTKDREAFAGEIDRFEDGIRWLERDDRLLLAFKLTNRTMLKSGELTGRRNQGWRLFQLVFLVSQLSALTWREHPADQFVHGLWGDDDSADPTEAVSVLWYPTGGGKTEAYLGLIVCCLFYDRARGKSSGTSAWCRFPLRLLTLQQTQRQLEVVAAADLVREDETVSSLLRESGGSPGSPFRVGFYAGSGNTPNALDAGLVDRMRRDASARNRYRLVDRCPYCRSRNIEVLPPDPVKLQLIHRCSTCKKVLPILVTDREIYRYLPAVVVGTLDKLAAIGLTDKFGSLLGDVDCLCRTHGYGRGGKCHERSPDHKETPTPLPVPLYDASPTLEIIDELHMVDEELGAFSGHYEGLLAAVQRVLSVRGRKDGRGKRMKVVATSATIRGEDRQCEHLFGLRSVVVPLPGPSLDESFYWQIDRNVPLRRFVGILPTRTTAEMTVVRILTAAHTAIRRLEARQTVPATLSSLSATELDGLIDLYRTSLTYVTSLVDFGKIRRSLDTQVNEQIRQSDMRELKIADLTGDTPFDQVGTTLEDLGTNGGEIESVVATSMVSHGVDIDRLNLMVFNGMPRAMAEYIQASSRVGRKHLGVIFMIFNAVRERDRSHFRYHGKFHEYLDRMVEPVAINRWSRFAVHRTLPGLLMAQLLQVANRGWWETGHAPKHLHDLTQMKLALRDPARGGLSEAQLQSLLDALHLAYLTDRDEAAELAADLDDRVRKAIASITAAGAAASAAAGGSRGYQPTLDYLGLEYEPMTSLRDVAEGIPFITLPDRRP